MKGKILKLVSFYIFGYLLELRVEPGDFNKLSKIFSKFGD